MSAQTPNQNARNLSPEQIIILGERLASLTTYLQQEQTLLDFLRESYQVEAQVDLFTPPKSSPIYESSRNYPFGTDLPQVNAVLDQQGYHLIQDKNQFWAIFSIAYGDKDIGRLILKRDHPFQPSALETLRKISKIASPSIYATLQLEYEQRRHKQLSLVRSVTVQISQIKDLDLLTKQITELVQKTFNYSYVAIFLIDEDTGRLHFQASSIDKAHQNQTCHKPEFEQKTHPGFAIGEHMIGYVAETGKALIANDVTKEPRYKKVDSLSETKSEVVIPLKIESRILGVFDIQSTQRDAFDENDLLVLQTLANNIAIAIENARLYQGLQNRADQLAAVSDVVRAITSILDIDELLQRIVNLINERFGFPYVHLYTIDPAQNKTILIAESREPTAPSTDLGVSYDLDAKTGVISWVAKNGQTKRISDKENDPLFTQTEFIGATRGSELAIPLSFGDEILGVLDIQSETKNAFSPSDQQLMEILADNIAIAIRNARLYHSEKWRRQVAESLRDIAGLLSDNKDLSDILHEIVKQLHKNLPCDIAGIWLFEPETATLPLELRELRLAAYQTSEDYPSDGLQALTFLPDAWVSNALKQTLPTIREPDQTQGPIAKHFDLPQDYASIAAPLLIGDEILGMLTLDHHSPGRYGLESQKITSAFASYAAIAIKNTRLFTTSQEQAWISTILLQVATATQSITNLDELATTIVRLTPMVLGVKGCALFLREPDSDIFSLYASYGFGDSADELFIEQPLILKDAPIFDELLIFQKPLHVSDPDEELHLPESFTQQMSQDNLLLLPLIARDEMLGAFLIASESDPDLKSEGNILISEERYRIVQGIIQQTAIAVENIGLLEARQEEAYVSTVLLQSAQAAVSSENVNDTLDSIVHIMPILVGIEASVIYFWEANQGVFQITQASIKGFGDEKELLGVSYKPGDFPMLDAVFNHNRPIVYPFVESTLPPEDWDLVLPDEGQEDPSPVLQSRYPLLMGFPLSMQDDVFGVLLAQDKHFSSNRNRRFELLLGMSQQASLAIQNDILNKEMIERQRLEREFQLAREIQQTFLPDQMPDIPGWELAVYWEPARQVGGDFYDFFLLPDGRLAFVIADVSDKGLAASLYMTVTRTLLRAAALESDSSSKTLERVNDLLLSNSQNGLFVTTFYGILSLDDGILTFTIAGHNPPLIIKSREREIYEFEKGGIALGALPNIHLGQDQVQIHSGDCLVLYTDGVTEAFDLKDQMYGEERLKRILKTAIGDNAHDLVEKLKADLQAFRDNAQLSDDTTILAICRSQTLSEGD